MGISHPLLTIARSSHLPFAGRHLQPSQELTQRQTLASLVQQRKDRLLTLGDIPPHALRW
jgi:hypothetical protein